MLSLSHACRKNVLKYKLGYQKGWQAKAPTEVYMVGCWHMEGKYRA